MTGFSGEGSGVRAVSGARLEEPGPMWDLAASSLFPEMALTPRPDP
jgi:hypothetical protein